MPRKCMIPNCYITNAKNKVHLFAVSTKDDILLLWQNAINASCPPNPIVLKPKLLICEKHFAEGDVLSQRELRGPDGKILGVSTYSRKQVRKGAAPCIFPWTPSLIESQQLVNPVVCSREDSSQSDRITSTTETANELGKDQTTRGATDLISHDSLSASGYPDTTVFSQCAPVGSNILPGTEINEDAAQEFNDTETSAKSSCDAPELIPSEANEAEARRQWGFQDLSADDSLKLPPSWSRRNILSAETQVVHFSIVSCVQVDGVLKTGILKEIIVEPCMKLQIRVAGNEVDISKFGIATTVTSRQDIHYALSFINQMNVCSGCEIPSELKEFESSVTYTDNLGRRRHNKCPLLFNSKQCHFCKIVKKSLARKKNRQSKENRTTRRRRFFFAPHHQLFVKQLQNRLVKVKKQKKIIRENNRKLREKLSICQSQMANMSTELVNEKMKHENIPKNQVTAVHEILEAAKRKSPKGRRYSEPWLMLCMILHMRSPAGYNVLKDNEILPLPSATTIRRNLAIMDTTCGFDPRFFELMKKFLDKKEEINRHGILLLDEMMTRESVSVNTTKLTYTGLVDLGDGNVATDFKERANHGLVFMFKSITESYTQPIAAFAARGPTTGIVLSELVVKAIILLEKAGAKVHGVVCDGGATNRKFWKELGVDCKRETLKNYFPHPIDPSRKIYVFSDTPHLIKTVRNRLVNKSTLQMDPLKPEIKWKHFEDVYDAEKNNPGKLRVCPKITPHHLKLNNSAKNTFENHPITAYASMKLDDNLVHPNRGFYLLITKIEALFQKHCNSTFVFEAIITDAIDQEILSFPCPTHAQDVLCSIILYYVRMRMHRYAQRANNDYVKENQLKKKMSKFCNT